MSEDGAALDPSRAVCVGRVVGVHGLKGEIKVEALTDFPDRFEAGASLWLDGAPVRVELSRAQAKLFYLKLAGVDDRDAAEALRGHELLVPEARSLDEPDLYYEHDLIGLRVEDESGAALGRLAEILRTGANDVYVVRGDRGELLLPALADVIREVDIGAGRMGVALAPGLEFQASSRPARQRKGAETP